MLAQLRATLGRPNDINEPCLVAPLSITLPSSQPSAAVLGGHTARQDVPQTTLQDEGVDTCYNPYYLRHKNAPVHATSVRDMTCLAVRFLSTGSNLEPTQVEGRHRVAVRVRASRACKSVIAR